MIETGHVADELTATMERGRGAEDRCGAVGVVTAELFGPDGELKWSETVHNLITTAGDAYYVGRAVLSTGLPTQVTGMKLGTGTTAVAKTGAGAALVTYITGSNKTFDSGFPTVSTNVATFKRTYAAGEATSATAISECVIVNDAATDATSTAANTISRALFSSPAAKAAGDVLVVSWSHTVTGA